MQYPISDPGSKLYNGKFHDGDVSQGIASSADKAAHMNAAYDEIINAITALGETPTEGLNDQLKTGLETLIDLINAPLPTLGEVGSYAFLYTFDSPIIPGTVYPGSALQYSGVLLYNSGTVFSTYAGNPPGSWRAMGSVPDIATYTYLGVTLFLRVL